MKNKTSWGEMADWYDDLITNDSDSFQKKVILPNLIRLANPNKDNSILDLACGQGYFSFALAKEGSKVLGCDISSELVALANKHKEASEDKNNLPEFRVSPADNLSFLKNDSVDTVTVILALQNIEDLAGTMSECSRVLKTDGKLIIVLNHPAFRIPQSSSWQWDETGNKQYRRIDAYMSDQTLKIDMTPGERDPEKKKWTVSFHRPLQSYFKTLNKSGLAVTRLEEWISHKKSQKGPRSDEEDRIRKEIPMFICLECRKI